MKGKITISKTYGNYDNPRPVRITITDTDANIDFVEVNLSLEEIAEALLGLAHVECDIVTHDLHNVGKLRQMNTLIVRFPDNINHPTKQDAHDFAIQQMPDSWELRDSFTSQKSFFEEDGWRYARANIVRWVDKKLP